MPPVDAFLRQTRGEFFGPARVFRLKAESMQYTSRDPYSREHWERMILDLDVDEPAAAVIGHVPRWLHADARPWSERPADVVLETLRLGL